VTACEKFYHGWINTMTSSNKSSWKLSPPKMKSRLRPWPIQSTCKSYLSSATALFWCRYLSATIIARSLFSLTSTALHSHAVCPGESLLLAGWNVGVVSRFSVLQQLSMTFYYCRNRYTHLFSSLGYRFRQDRKNTPGHLVHTLTSMIYIFRQRQTNNTTFTFLVEV